MPTRFIDVCLWGRELGILEEGKAEGAMRARNLFHLNGDPLSFKRLRNSYRTDFSAGHAL